MIEKTPRTKKQRHRKYLLGVLCLLVAYISASTSKLGYRAGYEPQQVVQGAQSPQKPLPAKTNAKIIRLITAALTTKSPNFDYQVIMDSVIFLHDGAYLYCDSAHYDEKNNSFEAYSRVRMEQGDTLFLYGNYMHYDGNTKLVRVRENVRLEHVPKKNPDGIVTLFTDSLNYDRNMNLGYYFDGGMIVDSQNELTSFWGQYEPNITIATFLDSVKVNNPKFKLYSDTLKYNTTTKIAIITSPTEIVSDSGIIYTSEGWYNTATDHSLLLDRSRVLNKKGDRILIGDSIFYDRTKGYGEVFGNMFMHDTTNQVILKGDYGYYDEINSAGLATKRASAIEYSQGDSLFVHADTLKLKTDSIFREIKGYYGVRFFRSDMQGVCDSLQFNSRDSILHLYRDPIIWNAGNQIYGDTIDIFMNDSTIDHIHVKKYSFSIEQKDSLHFNQLKGRSLKAFIQNKKVRRVLVEGNAESIFFPQEKDGVMTGLNWTEGSFIEIFLKEGQMEKLKIWPKPMGKLTPMFLLEPEQLKLKDFYWYDYLRPLDKHDIFRKVSKKKEDVMQKQSSVFDLPE